MSRDPAEDPSPKADPPSTHEAEPDADDEPFVVAVAPSEQGERLDKLLASRIDDVSRSTIQRWLEAGLVTMDGVVCDRRARARVHAELVVRPAPPPAYDARPEAIALTILFEDEHLIVLEKPAGLVVHPAPGHPSGTLVNALLHHTVVGGGDDASRPGIVHRLDKDTSGVMVVAKTPLAHERLVAKFAAHDLDRKYRAIALGAAPDAITFDTFHHRHPVDRKRFTSRVAHGRRAVTHLRTVERVSHASLVECTLATGRTHQIRVHLSENGLPLLGDTLYGGSVSNAALRRVGEALGRQALHAARLAFAHPITNEALAFETRTPPDFEAAWAAVAAMG